MEQQKLTNESEFTTPSGVTFKFRNRATRGDKYEMNSEMAEGKVSEDGKVIKAPPGRLYPYLIKRYVTGWNRGTETSGKVIFDILYAEDADPKEDLIMVIGAHLLMNIKGLVAAQGDDVKKKD